MRETTASRFSSNRLGAARVARLASISVFLVAGTSSAQQVSFRSYSVEDGLAQTQVEAIHQDRSGVLWLGTFGGGLSRFDGRRFETIPATDVPGTTVTAISETPDGVLWVGTDAGLVRYDGRFSTVPSTSALTFVTALAVDAGGRLLVGTTRGLRRVRSGRLQVATAGLESGEVTALHTTPDGASWAVIDNGRLIRLAPGRVATEIESSPGLPADMRVLSHDPDGKLLIGASSGLFRWNDDRLEQVAPLGLGQLEVTALVSDGAGDLWIGHARGVARVHGGSVTHYSRATGLPGSSVRSLALDREGALWIGTDGDGLLQFLGNPFVHFDRADGLPGTIVWSLARDSEQRLWVGTDHGAAILNGSRFEPVAALARLAPVYALHRDRIGTLWIGSRGGLSSYDGAGLRRRVIAAWRGTPNIRTIAEGADGSLWVGGHQGLVRRERDQFQPIRFEGVPRSPVVAALVPDGEEGMWVGTWRGLYHVSHGSSGIAQPVEGPLGSMTINSMAAEPGGALWLGTLRGVARRSPGETSLSWITPQDGLGHGVVYLLLMGAPGSLWIGTNHGLDRLDLQEFNRTRGVRLAHYGVADGVVGPEPNSRACYRDTGGVLWFGTIGGAIRYDPSLERAVPVPGATHLVQVRLFERDVIWERSWNTTGLARTDALETVHDRNHLTFRFVSPYFTHPERLAYSHRMQGLEQAWSEPAAEQFAAYPSLPPGNYVFEVRSCLTGAGCAGPIERLEVRVRPAFWNTGWFRFVAGVCVILGAVFGVRLRERNARHERERLAGMVQQRTLELETAKAALEQANRHLEGLAHQDGLTGLANRSHFDERLGVEWRRGMRTGTQLSLVFVDVDHFKKYNDTYGHVAGDQCLRQVGAAIAAVARRAGELGARYGGEEFANILPNSTTYDAREVAERLRLRIEALAMCHAGSTSSDRVTISLGVASTVPSEEQLPGDLVVAADAALYRAKRHGRNRVETEVSSAPGLSATARLPRVSPAA